MENFSLPIQADFAHAFALEWAEAWNSHDLDRILAHYSDQVALVSPVALNLLKNGTGIVQGKSALRDYFQLGLKAYPDLHFELKDVLWGVETIVAYYGNECPRQQNRRGHAIQRRRQSHPRLRQLQPITAYIATQCRAIAIRFQIQATFHATATFSFAVRTTDSALMSSCWPNFFAASAMSAAG